jgi:hypothetical protein
MSHRNAEFDQEPGIPETSHEGTHEGAHMAAGVVWADVLADIAAYEHSSDRRAAYERATDAERDAA